MIHITVSVRDSTVRDSTVLSRMFTNREITYKNFLRNFAIIEVKMLCCEKAL